MLVSFVRQQMLRLQQCKQLHILVTWTVGLLFGVLFSRNRDPTLASLMRQAASCRMSIVGILCCFLPFLLAAHAAYIGRPFLLLLVCSCKSFSFSFVAAALFRAFGTAGWLIWPMVHFTQLLTLPVFCWFCLRWYAQKMDGIFRNLGVCIGICAFIAGMDYFVVSPFVAGILSN